MKFSIKRTLSLLLVLVMLVGLLPIVALANGETGDPTNPPADTTTYAVVATLRDVNGTIQNNTATVTGASGEQINYSNLSTLVQAEAKNLYTTAASFTITFASTDSTSVPNTYATDPNWPTVNGTPSDTCSIYANVVPNYTVTFNSDGGSVVTSQIVAYNGTANMPSAPTKESHTFLGWYLDGTPYNFSTPITNNVELTAKWEASAHVHTWTEEVTKAPTCTATGTITLTCTCGETKTEELPMIPHTLEKVAYTKPTCVAGNKEHWKCKVCGKLFDKNTDDKVELKSSDVVIPANKNHTSSSWIVGQYPTEKRNGYMYKVCTVCGTHLDYMVLTWRDVKPTLPFVDVDSRDSYFDAVCYVYDKGLMKGTSDTRFSPSRSFDRAMVAMILYRMEGRPSVKFNSIFPDVSKNDWYADCISWAYKNGVLKGYDDGTARPDDPVTVEQLLTILYRYADSEGYRVTGRGSVDRYYDADDISAYALKAVRWAVSEGLISGRGYLGPKSNASRAEVAEILTNFCKNVLNYK